MPGDPLIESLAKSREKLAAIAPGIEPFGAFNIPEVSKEALFLCVKTSDALIAVGDRRKDEPQAFVLSDLRAASTRRASSVANIHVVLETSKGTFSFHGQPRFVLGLVRSLRDAGIEVDLTSTPDALGKFESELTAPPPSVLMVTTDTIPGFDIVTVKGIVAGASVQARAGLSDLASELKSAIGGELRGATKMALTAGEEVQSRLADAARALDANAVVGVRFNTGSFGSGGGHSAAVTAYGTAVSVRPRDADAT